MRKCPYFSVQVTLPCMPFQPFGKTHTPVGPATASRLACKATFLDTSNPAPPIFQVWGEWERNHPPHAEARRKGREICSAVSAASLKMSPNPIAEGFFTAPSLVKAVRQLEGNICSLRL